MRPALDDPPSVDDEDHTADWLRQGQVLAAVTGLAKPVAGCTLRPLGRLAYRATASPEFIARHFPYGVTAEALAAAPALTFNQRDRLQHGWAERIAYNRERMAAHGLRRAAEMKEVAATLRGLGVEPTMSEGTVKRQYAAGEQGIARRKSAA